jgi:hypothetical protein
MAETPAEAVDRPPWPWSVVGALWLVLRSLIPRESRQKRVKAVPAWGSVWSRIDPRWRWGQAYRQSETSWLSCHPQLPLGVTTE